jgi:putative flippase GtrA
MTLSLPAQIGRFGMVGLFVVALDYAMFAALFWAMPGEHLFANVAGKLAGAVSGFFLHRNISFGGKQRDAIGRQGASYALLFAFNLAMSTGLMWLLVDQLQMNPYWSRLLVDGLVILSSFIGQKLWVYRAA